MSNRQKKSKTKYRFLNFNALFLIYLFLASGILTGCGYTGPLYLPPEKMETISDHPASPAEPISDKIETNNTPQ